MFTSNVDGQFQKAGFAAERACEAHGSIRHLQCSEPCRAAIRPAADFHPEIDDWHWLERRSQLQRQGLERWLGEVERLVCIEFGAGTDIPTVRRFSEQCGGRLIRLNPGTPQVPDGSIGLALGGLAGIRALHAALRG